MDTSVNTIHRILLDASLPSTLEDLKNPTEDYIVNLLKIFLLRFGIDVNLIDRPLSEQHTAMLYYKDSDLVKLINLHAVVTQIFDNIFISDFSLIDIMSPGQKRLKRQAKFLSNFVLYTMLKKSEFNDRMDQIQAMSRQLEEIKGDRAQVLESMNNKALNKAKQLALTKKYEHDIQQMELKIENNNKRELELEIIKSEEEKENAKAKEVCGSIRNAVGKLSKLIAEKQAAVVHSPEEYQSRLDELRKQKDLKVQARDVMQEAIQDKKQSIKQMEEKLNFILSIKNSFAALSDTFKELKEKETKLDDIKKQIDSLNKTMNEQQTEIKIHNDHMDTEKNELQCLENEITSVCSSYNQLLSEKKVTRSKFEACKVSFNEECSRLNKIQADTRKVEEDTTAFLHSCQETYDKEIDNERDLRSAWRKE
ncbi:hypothetical protein X777_14206 [Ooceraea biroi]|uniref:Kinetochore protein Nuf2 N-terminal domain-containing protein n=1 Tax=Ooceraea biroi TaxID=2015173 RepID=A0A026VWI2_OOCBI|nr:hypothetical protein X777_14206 [Ooceraea biroi]